MKSTLKQSNAPVPQDAPQAIGFESATGYPVGPESSPMGGFDAVQRYAAGGDDGVVQLKSHFTSKINDADVKTPIESLSEGAKPYFVATGLPEGYYFHDMGPLQPAAYQGDFVRAHAATAIIEKASFGKNGDRDNKVIGPYGHFGYMERSIMGRPNRGNIFDGGHLIERSLMEDADADVHGNLAAQEGKEFNQDLMRGWEHIPEEYQRAMDFEYAMKLSYTDLTYTRTGKELVDAGVIHPGLLANLATIGKKEEFLAKVFTFDRWTPYKWEGEINAGAGKTFAPESFSKGDHYKRLQATEDIARQRVLGPDPIALSAFAPPPLVRTRSGEVSGSVSGLATSLDGSQFIVGGVQRIGAKMFTGVPQPVAEQPVGLRGGVLPAALPTFTGSINVLTQPFSLKRLLEGLATVQTKKKDRKDLSKFTNQNIGDAQVDYNAKAVPEYAVLREHVSAGEGADFVRAVKAFSLTGAALTKADLQDLARASFAGDGNKFVGLLAFDPLCILGDPPPVVSSAVLSVPSALVDPDDDVVDGTGAAFDPDDDVVDAPPMVLAPPSTAASSLMSSSFGVFASAPPPAMSTYGSAWSAPYFPPSLPTTMSTSASTSFGTITPAPPSASGVSNMSFDTSFPPAPLMSVSVPMFPTTVAPTIAMASTGTVSFGPFDPPTLVSAFPPISTGFSSVSSSLGTGDSTKKPMEEG